MKKLTNLPIPGHSQPLTKDILERPLLPLGLVGLLVLKGRKTPSTSRALLPDMCVAHPAPEEVVLCYLLPLLAYL